MSLAILNHAKKELRIPLEFDYLKGVGFFSYETIYLAKVAFFTVDKGMFLIYNLFIVTYF